MHRASVALILVLLAPLAGAHGGVAGPGDSLATATRIGSPAYLFFDAVEGVHNYYYRIDLAGEARVRLVVPADGVPSQPPLLLVFGEEFEGEVAAPPDLERPEMGGLTFAGTGSDLARFPALGFEGVALVDRELSFEKGEHVLVVRTYEAGRYALLVETGASPWLAPFLMPGLRDEGRAFAGVATWPSGVAGALAFAVVVALGWRTRARPWTMHAIGAFACAALVLASAAAHAAVAARTGVGWLHVAAPGLAALAALASTRPPRAEAALWQRALLVAAALVAFFFAAGNLWGPVAGVAGALLPEGPPKRAD